MSKLKVKEVLVSKGSSTVPKKNGRPLGRKTTMSAEEFVKVWQGGTSVRDVAEQCGLSGRSVRERAVRLRKKGVPLKKFYSTGRPFLDYAALTKLAKECAK
jgi:transposase